MKFRDSLSILMAAERAPGSFEFNMIKIEPKVPSARVVRYKTRRDP